MQSWLQLKRWLRSFLLKLKRGEQIDWMTQLLDLLKIIQTATAKMDASALPRTSAEPNPAKSDTPSASPPKDVPPVRNRRQRWPRSKRRAILSSSRTTNEPPNSTPSEPSPPS